MTDHGIPVRLLLPIDGHPGLTLTRDVRLPAVPRVGDEVLVDADEQVPVDVTRVWWRLDDDPGVSAFLGSFDTDTVADSPNLAINALSEQGWSQT